MITYLTFEQWVRYVFDHPVTVPAWHWDPEAESADLPPLRIIAYATKLFEGCGGLLDAYSDAQVNQGLWFLISETSPHLYALADTSIPLEERLHCIRSISALFEQCFVPRCAPRLSHLDEIGADTLNCVCYMWWDIFPLRAQPANIERREIDKACLTVMETTLRLPSIACQESALHGLGHWGRFYPDVCEGIAATYMKEHEGSRIELWRYAERARYGEIL